MLPLILLTFLCTAAFAADNTPVQINFNLVQVNKYDAQEAVLEDIQTPGQRVVIDVGQGETMLQYLAAVSKVPIRIAHTATYSGPGSSTTAAVIDWESHRVFCAPSGTDSFKVMASRTGCPGTEVGPSVAVSFASKGGWSDPIRFGPLTANTTCPLGHGFTLEVAGQGSQPPRVKLVEAGSSMLGKR